MKKLFAAVPVLALAIAALTACSGSSASNVNITGDFGGSVVFESGYPVSDPGDKVEVVEKGDKPATDEAFLVTRRTVFNGESGALLVSQASVLPVDTVAEDPEWLREVVSTTGVDQRSVIISTIAEVYGPGVGEQVGLQDSSPIVIVDDVLSAVPAKVTGTVQELPAGFPSVTIAEDGTPSLSRPEGDAPTELLIADRIVGDGATVAAGDDVVVQYQGTNWRTGEIFDQSWGRRIPASFNTEGVVNGFKQALVGQKVGSQVVVMIPPADGYGEAGNPQAGIEGTDVLVFVIDILATVPALPAAQ
jgi:hypothetical protein